MYARWLERTVYVDPLLADALVKERVGDALHRVGRVRPAPAARTRRPIYPDPGGWLARQACRALCGLGSGLVALGWRLYRYGSMVTAPAGERS